MDYLLVGNDAGQLEIWSIDNESMTNVIDTRHGHEATEISSIIELKDPSYLITGDEPSEEADRFIVTTSTTSEAFYIWRLKSHDKTPLPHYHVRIQTSLVGGIKHVLQTSPTQLVCVNKDKVIKFYDFIDKAAQAEKEEQNKSLEVFNSLVAEAFKEADVDNSGALDLEEVKPLCETLIRSFGGSIAHGQEELMLERMFKWLDSDNSGIVTFHEFKVSLMRAFIHRALPDELLGNMDDKADAVAAE